MITHKQRQQLTEIKEYVESSHRSDLNIAERERYRFLFTLIDEIQREAERLQQALNGYVPDAAKPRDPTVRTRF